MVNSKYHILKEYANGVMDEKGRFYPFKAAASASDTLSAKSGIRYFVKNCTITAYNSGAVASVTSTITGVKNGETEFLAYVIMPTCFAASNDCASSQFSVNVLLDIETAVTMSMNQAACVIIYAEIIEQSGEYLP